MRLREDKGIVEKIVEYETFIYGDYMEHYGDVKQAANNYGYTTWLNNAWKIATDLLSLIGSTYQLGKQE